MGYNYYLGSVLGSFWDIETSSQSTSYGGTGKTAAEMQTQSTFTDAGWDFIDTDGDPADWVMLRLGKGYPRLAWQPVIAGDIAGLYGVNLVDYASFANAWLSTPADANWNPLCDLYPDNIIDALDLQILVEHWLVD